MFFALRGSKQLYSNDVNVSIFHYPIRYFSPDPRPSLSDLYGLPDTRSDKSYRNYLQESLDPVFSILFILECAVKLVAMGFYSHENSYLRDSWNCLGELHGDAAQLSTPLLSPSSSPHTNSQL